LTDVIRVDPNTLHFYAGQISGIALNLRQLGSEVVAATSNAPSYDGQFGPRVTSVGHEAAARYQALAGRLETLSTALRTKADEFIQADLAAEADMMGAPPPGTGIGLAELFEEIPWWVILILGVLPFGDALGLLEELINSLSGRGVSQLNLWLSIFGLAADAGWIDLIIPDPVDGINVGLAGIKAALRTLGRLPPSAEKILLESLQAAVKNPDDLARIGRLLAALAGNTDLARRVVADDDALRALLGMKNGAEGIELAARYGDDAISVLTRFGDDGFQAISTYGDEGLRLLNDYGDEGMDALRQAQRAAATDAGGHMLTQHVAQSEPQLATRLVNEPRIPAASSFADPATAEVTAAQAIAQNGPRIEAWLATGIPQKLPLTYAAPGGQSIGYGIVRGGSELQPMSEATFILARDASGGWFILTGYPVP
jgi:hypothetical protein